MFWLDADARVSVRAYVYDCPIFGLLVIERDLEAIYSNSNILFPHKDAEILFSGFGFTFYGLRSELGASMYKLWLRDLLPFTGQLFHASKLSRIPLNAGGDVEIQHHILLIHSIW
jgi:hypothetical protein